MRKDFLKIKENRIEVRSGVHSFIDLGLQIHDYLLKVVLG